MSNEHTPGPWRIEPTTSPTEKYICAGERYIVTGFSTLRFGTLRHDLLEGLKPETTSVTGIDDHSAAYRRKPSPWCHYCRCGMRHSLQAHASSIQRRKPS